MYESYWKLQERPFASGCDPRFYWPGESHQAALLKLRYAVENRGEGAVLAGPPGSGKTLLVGMLRAALGEEFSPVVHLVFPDMAPEPLLAYLAEELDRSAEPADGVCRSVRRIERFLSGNAQQGKHAVVVIDEAHLLDSARSWETLRLLMNFQPAARPGWTLLLVGQTGLLPMLDRMPHFEQRLAVKCLLRPLTQTETAAYVQHRLRLAGATAACFEPDALDTLHQLAQGIPRRINRLCDLALLISYAEQCSSISAEQLEAVSQELLSVAPE
ncbi:MAG: ExeA family protein [Thermoguttaceae bacterium]